MKPSLRLTCVWTSTFEYTVCCDSSTINDIRYGEMTEDKVPNPQETCGVGIP